MYGANLSSLKERITILRKERQVSPHGYVHSGYAELRKLWASVIGYSSKYVEGRLENTNEIAYKVVMRFKSGSDLHAGDRLIYRGRTLEFITEPIAVEGKRAYIFMDAREMVEDVETENQTI